MDALNYIETRLRLSPLLILAGSVLWLLMGTATVIESDTYRYAALILSGIALYFSYTRLSFVKMHWAGWLCMAWAVYAIIRFLVMAYTSPGHQRGASEWLYFFPLLFPVLGLALVIYRPYVTRIISAYFVIVLAFLLVLTDYRAIIAGEAVSPLIQHNRIHGAVACGFILIAAFFWLMHNACRSTRVLWQLRLSVICVPLIIPLCLLNIYGSKSKGVWLALAVVLPLMYLLTRSYLRSRILRAIALAMVVAFAGGLAIFWDNIARTAGPTITAIGSTVHELSSSGDVADAVQDAIRSGDTPMSMNERMQLWTNAWEIFETAPIFGQGNYWLDSWQKTRYSNVGYTLMHNGYLEILVRHGLFGMAVFLVLLVSFLTAVRRCHRDGLISLQTLHGYYIAIVYFCVTLLSNSNNRLAIGESFFLIVAAIAFHCMILSSMTTQGLPPERRAA